MNFLQVLCGVLITLIVVAKSFTVKVGTKYFSSKEITFANCAFLVFLIYLTLPFMGQ